MLNQRRIDGHNTRIPTHSTHLVAPNTCQEHLPDSSCPHSLVQLGVNSHIRGLHLLIRKLFDGFDGTWGSSLKPTGKKKKQDIATGHTTHSSIAPTVD